MSTPLFPRRSDPRDQFYSARGWIRATPVGIQVVSVTFSIVGHDDDDGASVNIANSNARELLAVLGIPGAWDSDLCGEIRGPDLARLCLAYVNTTPRDPGRQAIEAGPHPGARYFECGRRPGYLHDTANRLWRLALRAGARGIVTWG